MMEFKELDEATRKCMLEEFKKEEANDPYRSKRLIGLGLEKFPALMEKAIKEGNEVTLEKDLNDPSYWKSAETSHSGKGDAYSKGVPMNAAKTLALSEFSTWYTRGLSK